MMFSVFAMKASGSRQGWPQHAISQIAPPAGLMQINPAPGLPGRLSKIARLRQEELRSAAARTAG
jgi:hypothetical protein